VDKRKEVNILKGIVGDYKRMLRNKIIGEIRDFRIRFKQHCLLLV
jgi:hypothetical protein